MPAKRTITVTAPDGHKVSVNVGPTRAVAAIRIILLDGGWTPSVHRTLEAAITGPNQTPNWNTCPRYAVAIGADDQPTGPLLPAHK